MARSAARPGDGHAGAEWNLPWDGARSVYWSPDGGRILVAVEDAPAGSPQRVGFAIVDVATGQVDLPT
jgi:hypothetical protein